MTWGLPKILQWYLLLHVRYYDLRLHPDRLENVLYVCITTWTGMDVYVLIWMCGVLPKIKLKTIKHFVKCIKYIEKKKPGESMFVFVLKAPKSWNQCNKQFYRVPSQHVQKWLLYPCVIFNAYNIPFQTVLTVSTKFNKSGFVFGSHFNMKCFFKCLKNLPQAIDSSLLNAHCPHAGSIHRTRMRL